MVKFVSICLFQVCILNLQIRSSYLFSIYTRNISIYVYTLHSFITFYKCFFILYFPFWRSSAKRLLNANFVYLNFYDKITVNKIVVSYDFGTLLVEIGSSLGLWLGLSIVGVYEAVAGALCYLKKGAKKNYRNVWWTIKIPSQSKILI